jgi:plasmid stability protein
MATHTPNIYLPESVLAALRERAAEQQKSVEEIAGELILRGLSEQNRGALEGLQEYGHQKALERYRRVPTEEEVVEIVRTRRQARQR